MDYGLNNGIAMDKSIIIAIIGSGALTALITNICNMISAGSRQRKVNQVLLLGEMERRIEIYRNKGGISSEQLQLFTGISELYHAEGGNGYADGLISEARTMPRV